MSSLLPKLKVVQIKDTTFNVLHAWIGGGNKKDLLTRDIVGQVFLSLPSIAGLQSAFAAKDVHTSDDFTKRCNMSRIFLMFGDLVT
jgi:hypothetical protein